jgi:hypothetical protein
MGNYLGSLHWVGFKPQATPGTPEDTVTRFLPGTGLVMEPNRSLVDRVSSAATGHTLPPRAGAIAPSGSYQECEVHASLPHPWYWLLGAVATTTPVAGVKLHTITEADDPVNLTCEGYKVHSSAKQGDVRLGKLSLNATPGELAKMSNLEWLGLSHDADPTLTSVPVFTTDPLVCTAVSVKIDGSQVFTTTSSQIDLDRVLQQIPVLTNVSGGQPQLIRRTKALDISGALDFLDFPTAEYAKMIAATPFALIVELQGAVITQVYDTYKYFLRVTLPSCVYTGGLDTEAAAEMMTGSAQFKAHYDTVTGRQILVEAQNAVTVLTD